MRTSLTHSLTECSMRHGPGVRRPSGRPDILVVILLVWGSVFFMDGARSGKAFGDDGAPLNCTANLPGTPTYRQTSATYFWRGRCTPWTGPVHLHFYWRAQTGWSRPPNGVVGTVVERITIERITTGDAPETDFGEPFTQITIQTKGLCGDDPWLTGAECAQGTFQKSAKNSDTPPAPYQIHLLVEAWMTARLPITQIFATDRAALAQERQHQLDQQALAARKGTTPSPPSTFAGSRRMVTLLEPSANAILFGEDGLRVRVARPQEASTSYDFQFSAPDKNNQADEKSMTTQGYPAPDAEAGVGVSKDILGSVRTWPGHWLVRVRVHPPSGGDERAYPWSEWRPFEMRQKRPPVVTTPKPR